MRHAAAPKTAWWSRICSAAPPSNVPVLEPLVAGFVSKSNSGTVVIPALLGNKTTGQLTRVRRGYVPQVCVNSFVIFRATRECLGKSCWHSFLQEEWTVTPANVAGYSIQLDSVS